MTDLLLKLDTTDFKELAELGRSLIPTVAPDWTDHNVHDPGVMLMELVAWIADAQVYAVGRSSRGEREAYGRLVGLDLTGPQPARGLIWPRAADAPAGTPAPWDVGTVVNAAATVTGDRPKAPTFFTTRKVELTTAALTQVVTEFADGSTRDWTRANSQEGATFFPFGEDPQSQNEPQLRLHLDGVLIGAEAANRAPIAIGFELITDGRSGPRGTRAPVKLRVSLTQGTTPWPISIVEDTTMGLSRSGVLLLNVDAGLKGQKGPFTLTIDSANGFLLAPRVQRLALNVLPIEQVEACVDEVSAFGTDVPDQAHTLRRTGLMFPLDDRTFSVLLPNGKPELEPWKRISDLTVADPDATVYAVDETKGIVTFGNGINGRRPATGASLRVEYRVTSGAKGNLPRGIEWRVAGAPATFINSEPTADGSDGRDLARLRAEARRLVHASRPIVTAADLESSARAFDDLAVRRALELGPGASPRRLNGARVLVVVGPHDPQPTSEAFTESALWLGEIRRRLKPRLPLGQSLDVIGPRLADVHVVAHLVAAPQRDPEEIRMNVQEMLRSKLAITAPDEAPVWRFGRDVTALTAKGWLRKVEGVARVLSVTLRTPASPDGSDRVALGAIGLPRLVLDAEDLTIDRSPIGGRA